jgi:hypothetical protein
MKSDLQQAALQRLARLTQSELLSPDRRANLADRVLQKCQDQKKPPVNGVNGMNGTSSLPRTVVCHVNFAYG